MLTLPLSQASAQTSQARETEDRTAMDHRDLAYPVLVWGEDYTYLARTVADYERTPRSQFKRLRRQARDGKVMDKLAISTQKPILKWFCEFRTAPVLTDGKRLELDEFKRHVERAIWVRQRGDYDCDFIGELRKTLPLATSYREALACVPKGM
jgi:hypothetical protein